MSSKAVVLRIFLGFVLPPVLGALVLTIFDKFFNTGLESGGGFFGMWLGLALVAFLFVGFQSLIYTFFMEYLVNRTIESNVWAVLASMALGILSGMIIPSLMFLTIGATVGLIVGIVLRYAYVKAER